MWINRALFEHILADHKAMSERLATERGLHQGAIEKAAGLREQKTKDDSHLDWLRHRVNQLEKERQILLLKAAGISIPVPEMQTTPNVVSTPAYEIPSFDDMGDLAAAKAGILHDEYGELVAKV